MFKRIHSNREPGVTVYSELKKEFSRYDAHIRRTAGDIVKARPKTVFVLMVVLMTVSAVLSVTVMRQHEPVKIRPVAKVNAVSDGFNQILGVAASLKQTLSLKKQIDSLSAGKVLSRKDSLLLEGDLDKLQQLNKKIKP